MTFWPITAVDTKAEAETETANKDTIMHTTVSMQNFFRKAFIIKPPIIKNDFFTFYVGSSWPVQKGCPNTCLKETKMISLQTLRS